MPLLGALGPSLDGLGRVSGCSWEVLGPLGRVLGGSWAALGGSWTLLGRSWRPSWDHPITRSKTRPSTLNRCKLFGSILEPQMGPKTTPRQPQNESKFKTKNASLFDRSWTRLGPVLRRSWAHLGVDFGDFSLENVGPRENHHF